MGTQSVGLLNYGLRFFWGGEAANINLTRLYRVKEGLRVYKALGLLGFGVQGICERLHSDASMQCLNALQKGLLGWGVFGS